MQISIRHCRVLAKSTQRSRQVEHYGRTAATGGGVAEKGGLANGIGRAARARNSRYNLPRAHRPKMRSAASDSTNHKPMNISGRMKNRTLPGVVVGLAAKKGRTSIIPKVNAR